MGVTIGQGININEGIFINFESSAAPTNLTVPVVTGTPTRGQTLSTTNGTWNGGVPYIYNITYQWQRGTSNIVGATSNTYVLGNSDVGSTIRSSVIATNLTGSTIAFSANTAIVGGVLPSAPTNVIASSFNSTTANVSWTAPVDDGGSAITNYVIRVNKVLPLPVSNTYVNVGNVTSTQITGLTTGYDYNFSVSAINGVGTGPESVPSGNIEIRPAIGEIYGGGIVVSAGAGGALVVSTPTNSGTTYANYTAAFNFCINLSLNGYTDWVMPGLAQANTMYTQRALLSFDLTPTAYYWTTGVAPSPGQHYVKNMSNGQLTTSSDVLDNQVRAVRTAFY